jgi:alpha-tubulin suppressor-like RCC1 family protein
MKKAWSSIHEHLRKESALPSTVGRLLRTWLSVTLTVMSFGVFTSSTPAAYAVGVMRGEPAAIAADRAAAVANQGPMAAPVLRLGHGANANHMCAVLKTGHVLCWGKNTNGQLGIGGTTASSVPVTVSGMTDAVDVAMGDAHTCVLRSNGQVQCVGADDKGQLGNGALGSSTTLTDVLNAAGTGPLTGVTSLSVGQYWSCAVRGGSVVCWGRQRSDWDSATQTSVHVQSDLPEEVPGLTDASSVAVGAKAACAVRTNGEVQCWGFNGTAVGDGIFGTGASQPLTTTTPLTVKDPAGSASLTNVSQVRLGEFHVCAVLMGGGHYCWGDNNYGQLANGARDDSWLPTTSTLTTTLQPLVGIVKSGPGMYHGCALSAAGYVYCTGDNYNYSLGIGHDYTTSLAVTVPVALDGEPLSGLVDLGSHYDGSCVMQDDGDVYCWGENNDGKVGNGNTTNQASPVRVILGVPPEVSLSNLTIEPGSMFPAFVSTTMGYAVELEAGSTDVITVTGTPELITSTVTYVSSAGACTEEVCPVAATGTTTVTVTVTSEDGASKKVYLVGALMRPQVTQANVVEISQHGRAQHTCALLENGGVLCWGQNDYGQLGIGTKDNMSVPVAMQNITDATEVATGRNITCVLREGGRVQCVGGGADYGLGNGQLGESLVLTDVLEPDGSGPLTGATTVEADRTGGCVVRGGEVVCWGWHLENPDTGKITSTLPVTVAGFTNIVEVVMTHGSICGMDKQGLVHCMGANYYRQLGIGQDRWDYPFASSPQTVLTVTNAVDISGGGQNGSYCAVMSTENQICWGGNDSGMMGNGFGLQPNYPVTSTLLGMSTTAMGGVAETWSSDRTVCVRHTSGRVTCAGDSDFGKLGTGTWNAGDGKPERQDARGHVTVTRYYQGPPLTDVTRIGGNDRSTCALQSDGDVMCWGSEAYGRLGNGSTTEGSGEYSGQFSPVWVIQAAPSDDAMLAELAIDPGVLTPAFVSTTMEYTAEVPFGTTSAAVTATTNDVSATVAYASTGGACSPGNASPSTCDIAASGATTITITTTAPDLTTTETYTIVVTVAEANASSDASLSSLTMVPGTLTPAFVSTTTDYIGSVPSGTKAVTVTATPSGNVDVSYASSAGECAPPNLGRTQPQYGQGEEPVGYLCDVSETATTWITVTVYALDGSTGEYVIVITPAAPLTTIDRVWPGTGLEAGGMPVQIFGTGFVAALTVTVGPYEGEMVSVPFTIESDSQIDFVMPPGVAGQQVSVTVQTADSSQTAANAFTYVQPDVIEVDGQTGGVFTTTDGVVVTIPPQGVDGMFVITMTPQPPAPGVPGNILMYAFRLEAMLNWVPLATLTNPVTIQLPVDPAIVPNGERPYLYQWVGGQERGERSEEREEEGSALFSHSSPLTSLSSGRWVLVRGQVYEPTTRVMTVALRPMGEYALSTTLLRSYWFPVVPTMK